MDVGRVYGSSWGSNDPVATAASSTSTELKLRLAKTPANSNYSGSSADWAFLYFGDFQNMLRNATINQIISARIVLTWKNPTTCQNSFIKVLMPGDAWTEQSVTSKIPYLPEDISAETDFTFNNSTVSSGGKTYIDIMKSIKRIFQGKANFGYGLVRFDSSGVGCGGDEATFYTREAADVNVRPTLEIVVDFSRPAYPAPTDSPSGLTIAASTGAATASWSGVAANTENIRVEISCSVSGAWSLTVPGSQRSVTRTGLRGGDRCTARATALNSAGSSPTSMSTAEVTISGTGPSNPPNTSLSLNGSQAIAAISNVSSDATEIITTISCSSSGQQTQTVPSGQTQISFSNIREGETCSAYSQARNQWGTSPTGPTSNSVLARGNPPGSISFTADAPSAGSARLSWSQIPSGATSIDATLSCQKAGQLTRTLSTSERSTTFSGLTAGDVCTPTMGASNQWGSSQRSSFSSVTIRGNAPATPRITQLTADNPEEFSIYLDIPSDASSLDLTIRCDSSGTETFSNIGVTTSVKTIKEVQAGDRCYAAVAAKNTWGTSSISAFTGPVSIKGKAPTQAPSGVSITAGTEQITIRWSNAPSDALVEVTAYCSASGTKKAVVNSNQYSYAFPAIGGESCYATLASKNDWGISPQSSRSISALVAKRASASNNSTSNNSSNGSSNTSKPSGSSSSNNSTAKKPSNTAAKPAPNKNQGSATKKSLICIKGSQSRTITGANPTCPAGWVKKPTISKN